MLASGETSCPEEAQLLKETKETTKKKRRTKEAEPVAGEMPQRKKQRDETPIARESDLFDALPDDVVVLILSKISFAAESPSDLIRVLMTCKRLKGLGMHPMVLSKASPECYMVAAKRWCEPAHRFMRLCADAGNIEACYSLGMIEFYCLQNRSGGTSLIAKAAIGSHAPALYSLAVIQFNGSGGSVVDKDLQAGVALCARAAFFGHVDALRELGHCLQDGYGVPRNVVEGRRFLVHANARELASVIPKFSSPSSSSDPPYELHRYISQQDSSPLLSDFGCVVPDRKVGPVSRFLREWFEERWGPRGGGKMRLCSHEACGRPETRPHEFRRCSLCAVESYCSRACQAMDWKLGHKKQCSQFHDDDYDSDAEQRHLEESVAEWQEEQDRHLEEGIGRI